jgi:hypothetical protein
VLGVWVPYYEPQAKSYEVVVYTGGPPPTLTLLMASDAAAKVIQRIPLPGVNPRLVTGLMCSAGGEGDDRLIAQFGKGAVRAFDGNWGNPENAWLIEKDGLVPVGLESVRCRLQSEGHE